MWRDLWRKPQAIIWEEERVERAVARYVRMSVAVDAGDAPTAKVKSVIEQERILLIELGSLLKAGYRITTNPQAPSPTVRSSPADARRATLPSSRGRLRALPDPRTRLRGEDD